MDTNNLCFKCMQNSVVNGVCSCCHSPSPVQQEPTFALPVGSILHGRYLVGKVLGWGGFGITYIALDLMDGHRVAIKEYMPNGLATRAPGETWMQISTAEEDYQYGLRQFLEEARIIYQLSDCPNIVKVEKLFEENHTAYYAMEYLSGSDLRHIIKKAGGKLPFEQTKRLLLPIFDALERVHARGVIHRDISPDNIFVCGNGQVKLLDFGAARLALSEKSQSIDVVLKRGYAPEEQYRSHGKQGPWTDVYALGCTLYYCITGQVPPESVERMHEDKCLPAEQFCVDLPVYAREVLKKAMAVQAQNRFPTIAAFKVALLGQQGLYPSPQPNACAQRATVISNSPVTPAGIAENSVWWRRLLAYLIDNVIVFLIFIILFYIFFNALQGNFPVIYQFILLFSILFAYNTLFEVSSKRATLGKLCFKLQVVNASGEGVPPGQICLRNLIKAVPCFIGYWIPLWGLGLGLWSLIDGGAFFFTQHRQTLHDLAAKTNVMVPINYRAVMIPMKAPAASKPQATGVRCISGMFQGTFFPFMQTKMVLGRNAQQCSIVFPPNAMGVSALHCGLVWDKSTSTVVVKDLGSTYGTFVSDGRKLTPGQMAVLRNGDSLTIGHQNTFVITLS